MTAINLSLSLSLSLCIKPPLTAYFRPVSRCLSYGKAKEASLGGDATWLYTIPFTPFSLGKNQNIRSEFPLRIFSDFRYPRVTLLEKLLEFYHSVSEEKIRCLGRNCMLLLIVGSDSFALE